MEDLLKIVLSRPSHPGNIGSTARAIKVMGFNNLALVKPKLFPHREADALASGATDILKSAAVFLELSDAVREETMVYGLTARPRHFALPILTPRQAAEEMIKNPQKTALIFGSENGGLLNEEINFCHKIITIETGDDYSSLNLAHAVTICLYELRVILSNQCKKDEHIEPTNIPIGEIINLTDHFLDVMEQVDFIDKNKIKHTKLRLFSLFKRNIKDLSEVKMLRGFLSAIRKKNL
ncbi:MAG: RNA methyltransferase [Pseudomonadota bacterium]|nr:RNA methyltransferase [Pseudomonadota bacterium]